MAYFLIGGNMKLPNRENAYIPSSKLSDYLLSKTHPIEKWKGRLFRAHGFNETNVDLLEKSLISIANYEEWVFTLFR